MALPLLDSMVPAMKRQSTAAQPTFVWLHLCSERDHSSAWTPAAEGANFEFNRSMKALEPYREHMVC